MHHGCERARERETEGEGWRDSLSGEGDRREDWMGRAGSPNTKGSSEITIFHSFARSNYFVQLKYRFSPLSPRPSRVCLLQCRPLSPVLPPPSASFALFPRSTLPRHPPYGSIDRAESSVILPLLTLAHPVVQPPLSLPRSPFRPSPSSAPSSVSLSLFRFTALPLHRPFLLSSFCVCLHAIPL